MPSKKGPAAHTKPGQTKKREKSEAAKAGNRRPRVQGVPGPQKSVK